MKKYGLEGFDAYQVAKEFFALVFERLEPLPNTEHKDQLIRAAESIMRNIGEAHPMVGKDRARRFRLAAGEASESGASLDIFEIRRLLDAPTIARMRTLLDRIRAMLWKLSRPG